MRNSLDVLSWLLRVVDVIILGWIAWSLHKFINKDAPVKVNKKLQPTLQQFVITVNTIVLLSVIGLLYVIGQSLGER